MPKRAPVEGALIAVTEIQAAFANMMPAVTYQSAEVVRMLRDTMLPPTGPCRSGPLFVRRRSHTGTSAPVKRPLKRVPAKSVTPHRMDGLPACRARDRALRHHRPARVA